MYSAPRYITQDCSLMEYSVMINNPTTLSQFPSAYQIKYAPFFLFFIFTYLGHFVWQSQEMRPIKPDFHCMSISLLHAFITINLMEKNYLHKARVNFLCASAISSY